MDIKASGHSNSEYSFQDLPPWAQVLFLVLIAAFLIWIFLIEPLIAWLSQNILLVIIFILIVAIVAYVYFSSLKAKKRKMELKKMEFERSQKEKGLFKFIDRFGKEYWVSGKDLHKLEKKDGEAKVKESLFYRVKDSIKKFEPSREYRNEFGYHTELQGWLKSHFTNAKVELKTGASRPDIIIDNIAIEVKGPTDNSALNTLATKCLKYSQYYEYLVIVLFEPRFSESNYNEIIQGIKRHFRNVEIIRKD